MCSFLWQIIVFSCGKIHIKFTFLSVHCSGIQDIYTVVQPPLGPFYAAKLKLHTL